MDGVKVRGLQAVLGTHTGRAGFCGARQVCSMYLLRDPCMPFFFPASKFSFCSDAAVGKGMGLRGGVSFPQ